MPGDDKAIAGLKKDIEIIKDAINEIHDDASAHGNWSEDRSVSKLVFAVVFVLLGWGAFGAVFAFFCTGLVAIGYGIWKAGSNVRLRLRGWPGLTPALKRELRYGLLVFCGTSFVTLFSFADVVIVKSLFSPEAAGLYSGVATIARIIFFLTGSIAMVLLPNVKLSAPAAANLRLLRNSFLLLLLLGGSALGFFALFPSFTIGLLIGSRYLGQAGLLPWLGLLLFVVSVTTCKHPRPSLQTSRFAAQIN
jgi:O-antigen/teichoic acid export membrane protein